MAEPQQVASSGGVAIGQDGPYVLVYDRGAGGLAVATFVLVLLSVILLLQSAVFGIVVLRGGSDVDGLLPLLMLLAGLVLLAATVSAYRSTRRALARPLSALVPVIVFDRGAGVLREASGQEIAPLHVVRVETAFGVGSSSRNLVVRYGDHRRIIARPNPFLGGMGGLHGDLVALLGHRS